MLRSRLLTSIIVCRIRKVMLSMVFSPAICSGQCLGKCAPQEDLDQMALVLGAALKIVNRVSGVRERLSGVGQLFFYLTRRADQRRIRSIGAARPNADAADHGSGLFNVSAAVE